VRIWKTLSRKRRSRGRRSRRRSRRTSRRRSRKRSRRSLQHSVLLPGDPNGKHGKIEH